MKRSLFTSVLSGALILCTATLSADTTEGGAPNNRPRWGQGGMRGGRGGQFGGGGMRWGGRGNQLGGGRGHFGGGMSFGSRMLGRISKESELQQKFPKEYAELAKQLIDAENKLQELAKKAKIELPMDNNHVYRQLKAKAPAEFAEIEKKLNARETMRDGFNELRALAEKHNLKLAFGFGFGMGQRRPGGDMPQSDMRPQMRRNDAAKIRAVREKFPKEWEQVRNLRREGKVREAENLTRDLLKRLEAPKAADPKK